MGDLSCEFLENSSPKLKSSISKIWNIQNCNFFEKIKKTVLMIILFLHFKMNEIQIENSKSAILLETQSNR